MSFKTILSMPVLRVTAIRMIMIKIPLALQMKLVILRKMMIIVVK